MTRVQIKLGGPLYWMKKCLSQQSIHLSSSMKGILQASNNIIWPLPTPVHKCSLLE